jgi:hypothetical protein
VHNWRNWINPYRLAWLAAVLLFACAVYWLLFLRPRDPASMRVRPEEVQSPVVDQGNPPQQQASKRPEPFSVDVSGASLTLSSKDGTLQMRVWADEAFKHGTDYSIKEGALQFVLDNRDTMLVRVSDAKMSTVSNIATVSGAIVGQLVDSGQYFSARKLTWDQGGATVIVSEVRYVGPSVEVTGRTMVIDLTSGEVSFEGPVEAGI